MRLRLRGNRTALAFNGVFVLVFLIVVGRLGYEFAHVRWAFDRAMQQRYEVNIGDYVENRKLLQGTKRYHEGRDYGREVAYEYDQHGFRVARAGERDIATDAFSVAVIGDSLAEGQFIPYDETLPHFLEEFLGPLPVYNLGVSGVDFHDELQVLRYALPRYGPDVVIWQWFLNDYYDYYAEGRALNEVFQGKRLFFERYLRPHMWNRVFSVASYEQFESIPDHTHTTFDEIDALVADQDLRIVFLMYPVPAEDDLEAFDFGVYSRGEWEGYDAYYRIFEEQVVQRGYPLVEVAEVIPDYDYLSGKWSVIPQDPHPGAYSNQRMAEILRDHLTELGLVHDLIGGETPRRTATGTASTNTSCDADEIRRLAAEHDLQLWLEPCGGHELLHYDWSPSGQHLYYETRSGPWIVERGIGERLALPRGVPSSNAIWYSDELLAFPQEGDEAPNIGVYDFTRDTLHVTPIELGPPDLVVRGPGAMELFLQVPDGTIHRLVTDTGQLELAFPWLQEPVLEFNYSRQLDLLAYRTATTGGVVVAQASTGESVHRFPGVDRASISGDGRLIALEGMDAAPGLSSTSAASHPLWIYDVTSDRHVMLPGFSGHDLEWHLSEPYTCSFVLSGIEGDRNIARVDLNPILRSLGIEFDPADLRDPAAAPSAPAAAIELD